MWVGRRDDGGAGPTGCCVIDKPAGLPVDDSLIISTSRFNRIDGATAMAASGQVFCEPFPFKTPTLDLSMVWLSHVDNDPAERWLRSRLEAFMSERVGPMGKTKPA